MGKGFAGQSELRNNLSRALILFLNLQIHRLPHMHGPRGRDQLIHFRSGGDGIWHVLFQLERKTTLAIRSGDGYFVSFVILDD